MELSGAPRRLLRSERDRVIAGVIGGLGEYLNIDLNILRLLAVALFIVSPAIMALLYLATVFLIPEAGSDKPPNLLHRLIEALHTHHRIHPFS